LFGAWRHDTPILRHPDTPTPLHRVSLPCLRRSGPTARLLARLSPGYTWRWGLKNPYGWEQWSFWWRLERELGKGEFDILHVQDPMLAYWCWRAREAGRLRTQEILAHGTEESVEFLSQFPCVQHLAPWHLEQSLASLAEAQRTPGGVERKRIPWCSLWS
jgi:hypothetical protein